jgi:polyhydroxyalkanoate synthesis regulator phasin
MDSLIKVKDEIGLHREMQSGAIVNTSSTDYNKYIEQRNKMKHQQERINKLEDDVADLRNLIQQMVAKAI